MSTPSKKLSLDYLLNKDATPPSIGESSRRRRHGADGIDMSMPVLPTPIGLHSMPSAGSTHIDSPNAVSQSVSSSNLSVGSSFPFSASSSTDPRQATQNRSQRAKTQRAGTRSFTCEICQKTFMERGKSSLFIAMFQFSYLAGPEIYYDAVCYRR